MGELNSSKDRVKGRGREGEGERERERERAQHTNGSIINVIVGGNHSQIKR